MAWQTPKTDWGGADGVRNSDFNRIEGNILELYNTESLKTDLTIYVSTTGNDTTGNGSYAAPYKTINKALSVMPKNLNGKVATISVAPGTYAEAVVVKGFDGTIIIASPAYNDSVTITSLQIDACACVIQNMILTILNTPAWGIRIGNCGLLAASNAINITNCFTGISISNGSVCSILGTLTLQNITNLAIDVNNISRFFAQQISGTNNLSGITAINGGVVTFGANNMSVRATMYSTTTGGRIYANAQASVPNY